MSTVAISLEDVRKSYGTTGAAVDGVTIAIREGEFFSLLGPSGCGKTTTLRMIAGFEVPDEGRIMLQGKDGTSVSANRRPVRSRSVLASQKYNCQPYNLSPLTLVFEQLAFSPHWSIYDHVAFGFKV